MVIGMGRPLTAIASGAAVVWLAWANGGYFPSEWGMGIVAAGLVCLGAVVIRDRIEISRRDVCLVGSLAGLTAWAAASALWTTADGPAIHEAERLLLYVCLVAAVLLVVDRSRIEGLVAGIVVGSTAVAVYALATRLAPGHVGGAYDPSSGYQLAEPIGYWNALGALTAVAALLAFGLAHHESLAIRIVSGAALAPLVATLYFTFSRGALIGLGAGLVALVALERERVRALVELGAFALVSVAVVLTCSSKTALTTPGATLQTAQAQGGRLIWQLVLLSAITAAVAVVLPRLTGRLAGVRVSPRVVVAAALLVVSGVLVGGLVAIGGPTTAYTRVTDAFEAEPVATDTDLDSRLLSVSGHGRAAYWRVALDMAADAPIVGTGAGTFERRWLEDRPVAHHARDAHSLYLETLGELGVVGLVLLMGVLVVPLTAVLRARRHGLGAPLGAVVVAFATHAAVDWQWEIAAVALPALACGAALVVLARDGGMVELRGATRGVGVAVAAIAIAMGLVVHAGNRAAAASSDALARGDLESAEKQARRARTFQPWSAEPWQLLGDARLAAGDDVAARLAYREAAGRDPGWWVVWLGLATADPSNGAAHLDRARARNPLSGDLDDLESELRTVS